MVGRGRGLPRGCKLTPHRPLPDAKVDGRFIEAHLADVGPARYDYAVLGNVLCEVPDQRSVLAALDALLKDGAYVFFSEHVKHRVGWKGALQDFFAPWWCTLLDGCNINRHTMDTVRAACPDWEIHQ